MQPKAAVCAFCLDLPDTSEMTEIRLSTGIKLFTPKPEVIKRLWLPNTFIKPCLHLCWKCFSVCWKKDFTLHVWPSFFIIPTQKSKVISHFIVGSHKNKPVIHPCPIGFLNSSLLALVLPLENLSGYLVNEVLMLSGVGSERETFFQKEAEQCLT